MYTYINICIDVSIYMYVYVYTYTYADMYETTCTSAVFFVTIHRLQACTLQFLISGEFERENMSKETLH